MDNLDIFTREKGKLYLFSGYEVFFSGKNNPDNSSLSINNYYKKEIYYIDADEIPGFLLLLKNHIFTARSEDTIFIFHV